MTQPIPVLITCVGGTMVPSALRWLRNHSRIPFELHGADAGEGQLLSAAFLDALHQVPMGGEKHYADVILDIVKRNQVKLVVPWSDGEAYALSSVREAFQDLGCEVLVSPPDVMERLRNKQETYRTLQAAGVAVPSYMLVETADQLSSAISECGFPDQSVVFKPIDGRGGRGLVVLAGNDTIPDWLGRGHREQRYTQSEFADMDIASLISGKTMVMPCLHAPVYDADVLARNGIVKSVVIRRRHNPAGIPWTGNTICRNKKFEEYVRAVAEVLKLDAVHDVDLMSDAQGNPALLEVNPRMSGSLAATLAAGVPMLDAAFASRLGIDLPIPIPDGEVEVVPYTEAVSL